MKFGQLTVIGDADKKTLPSGQKIRMIECECSCGKKTNVALVHLIRFRTKSCGCLFKTKKGQSNTLLHRRWKAMHERCMSARAAYGLRHISVCSEWHDFFVFKKWALQNGYQDNLQIDRIDTNKGYSPENCRFVTPKQNCNNRRITMMVDYNGAKHPFTQLLADLSIPAQHHGTIRGRILRGWPSQKAFDTPIRQGNYSKKS